MSSEYRSNLVDIRVHLHRTSDASYFVSLDGKAASGSWVMKEIAELHREEHWPAKEFEITLPRPVALAKGLVSRTLPRKKSTNHA